MSNTSEILLYDLEEADTWIIVHISVALKKRHSNFVVPTVDTDVVVILIGYFTILNSAESFWLSYGVGKKLYLMAHKHHKPQYGRVKVFGITLFHSFTGCDTISAFFRRGKRLAWEAWNCFPEVSKAYVSIELNPFRRLEILSPNFSLLQIFIVILYSKSSNIELIDEARMELFLFFRDNKSMEKIPPTADALLQYKKRGVYEASIWACSQHAQQQTPTPATRG